MKLAKKVTAKSLQKKGKLTFYLSGNQEKASLATLSSKLFSSIWNLWHFQWSSEADAFRFVSAANPAAAVQDTALLPRSPFETFRPTSDVQVRNGAEKCYFQTASVRSTDPRFRLFLLCVVASNVLVGRSFSVRSNLLIKSCLVCASGLTTAFHCSSGQKWVSVEQTYSCPSETGSNVGSESKRTSKFKEFCLPHAFPRKEWRGEGEIKTSGKDLCGMCCQCVDYFNVQALSTAK